MNPTTYEIIRATILVVTALTLVYLYLRFKAAGTERRMTSMLRRAGLDPDIATQDEYEAVVKAVRRRCKKCQAEDVCERWLAGDVEGGNEFCPNAEVFKMLAAKAGRNN